VVIGVVVAFPITVFVVSEFDKDIFAAFIVLFSILEAMLLSFWSRWIINSDRANRKAATV
ncbi:MAG: hypothetical protein K8R65_08225, partial [Nitrospirae bacterium]|nr:hypothetical protein [Nitrospirota bacterium]